jgi:hypothetical protein
MTPIDCILPLPRKIFRYHRIRQREAQLMGAVEERRGNKLSPRAVRTLAWFPRVLAYAIQCDCVPLDAQREALADPYVAFLVLMENYAHLAPTLEDEYVLQNPVSLALLIDDLLAYPKQSRRPIADYLEALSQQDPNRRIWLAPKEDWAALVADFKARPEFANPTTAAWAHFRLLVSPSNQLSGELSSLLATDEEYLYRTAFLFHQRSAQKEPTPQWDTLLRSIKTPRWAFHALRDQLAQSPETQAVLFNVLLRDLGWLVEATAEPLWTRDGSLGGREPMGTKPFMTLYQEVIRLNYISPIREDMHEYATEFSMPARAKTLAAQADQISLRNASLDQLVTP